MKIVFFIRHLGYIRNFEAFVLAFYFVFNLLGDLGVGGGQRGIQVDGHEVILCHRFCIFFLGRGWGVDWRFCCVFKGGPRKSRVFNVVFLWWKYGGLRGDCGEKTPRCAEVKNMPLI